MEDAYVIVIAKSKNNYSAGAPDIPGCITVGDTLEETLANMREALQLHLSDEEQLPEPHSLEYHLHDDEDLRDSRFIFASIPVAAVSPLAHA
ncbi:MAG: type II toxin-antitoxin system HicB family antitoxin [Opitutaceae bacterium]|jgi:predicted RNase H-like HicB family nuclease|nr:type II toxin-antitoxin system HicB family antitoxin [Opitutaceae bacterium]